MLMTFLSLVANSGERTELKAIFRCLPCSLVGKSLVSGASVEMKIKFVSSNPNCCVCSFNDYVVFAKILIKIEHLYIIQLYVQKLPCGTHTKSNWKRISTYADRDIRKRVSNCCLSVKFTQCSNLLLTSNR
jgi:hypothetical protein